MTTLETERIRHLVGAGRSDARITVVGLGSGGFPTMQYLVQSGFRRLTLIDPDALDATNLVKHPGQRSDLGRLKVDIAADWIRDRCPDAEVDIIPDDVTQISGDRWASVLARSDLVVSATDSNSVRHFINQSCVDSKVAMTMGLVHRGGVGGTVLVYRAGESGCYACMEMVAEGMDALPKDSELPVTDDEQELIYGRGIRNFSAPGLVADISMISALLAQATIGELLSIEGRTEVGIGRSEGTWISMRLRSNSNWAWNISSLSLPPIDGCVACDVRT